MDLIWQDSGRGLGRAFQAGAGVVQRWDREEVDEKQEESLLDLRGTSGDREDSLADG